LTDGRNPYDGMSNAAVMAKVPEGFRMGYPINARVPDGMYRVLEECWNANPAERPTFARISTQLEQLQHGTVGPEVQASLETAGLRSPAPAVAPRVSTIGRGSAVFDNMRDAGGSASTVGHRSHGSSVGVSGAEYEYFNTGSRNSGTELVASVLSEETTSQAELVDECSAVPPVFSDSRSSRVPMSMHSESDNEIVRMASATEYHPYVTVDTTLAEPRSAGSLVSEASGVNSSVMSAGAGEGIVGDEYVTVSTSMSDSANQTVYSIPPAARPRSPSNEPVFATTNEPRSGAASGRERQRSSDHGLVNPNPYVNVVKSDDGDSYMVSTV